MPHKSNPQPCQPRIVSAKAQSCDSMCHDYRVAFCVAALATIAIAEPAAAIYIREEPANALSLPTWAIHISSVIEWCAALLLLLITACRTARNHNACFYCTSVYQMQDNGDAANVDVRGGYEQAVLEGHELGYGEYYYFSLYEYIHLKDLICAFDLIRF